MKDSTQQVLNFLLRGERLTIQVGIQRLSQSAITQRVSELRKLGYKILDRHPVVNGKVAKHKEYWMEVERKPAPRDETLVRAHVRRLLLDEVVEEQPGLFA